MATPAGWVANQRPAEATTSYTGDPTAGWEAGPGGATGVQPKSANNPAGTLPGVPVMAITAETAKKLAGPVGN